MNAVRGIFRLLRHPSGPRREVATKLIIDLDLAKKENVAAVRRGMRAAKENAAAVRTLVADTLARVEATDEYVPKNRS